MWINPMLTIFVWGVVFALCLIVFSLWKWYWTDTSDAESTTLGHTSDRSDIGDPDRGR